MPDSTNDILNPLSLVLPSVTTTVRDTLVADVGTIIFNSTTSKLNFCKTKAAGAGNWEAVTSA
jgi:hypothetical protein